MTNLARANRQTLPGLRRHARRTRPGRQRRDVPVLRPRPRRHGDVSRLGLGAGRHPEHAAEPVGEPHHRCHRAGGGGHDRRRRAGPGLPGPAHGADRGRTQQHRCRGAAHRRQAANPAGRSRVGATGRRLEGAGDDAAGRRLRRLRSGRVAAVGDGHRPRLGIRRRADRIDVGRASATGSSISAARRAAATASSRRAGTSADQRDGRWRRSLTATGLMLEMTHPASRGAHRGSAAGPRQPAARPDPRARRGAAYYAGYLIHLPRRLGLVPPRGLGVQGTRGRARDGRVHPYR